MHVGKTIGLRPERDRRWGIAARGCNLAAAGRTQTSVPSSGKTMFTLITGIGPVGTEGGLGFDGSGAPRPNAHPCP
jgi:hypothetical protein